MAKDTTQNTKIEVIDNYVDEELIYNDFFEPRLVKKANTLILGKFHMSLFENQIFALSLSRLQVDGNQLTSVLYASEIKKLLGKKGDHNIYSRLYTLSRHMENAGNVISIEDGQGNFSTFTLITNIDYQGGVLTITYNKKVTPYLWNLTKRYTELDLNILASFKNNHAFRLYEVLKKDLYKLDQSPKGFVNITYNLSELKCMIGLVDTNKTYIKDAIKSNRYTWDEIVNDIALPEDKRRDSFKEFKRHVLDSAQKELAEHGDFTFKYVLERGRWNKVVAITFLIFKKTVESEQETAAKKAQEDLLQAYEEIKAYLLQAGVERLDPFTIQYFGKLMEAAQNDVEVIKREIDYSISKGYIRDFYGWLMSAVTNRYSAGVVDTINGSTAKADRINQIRSMGEESVNFTSIWTRQKNVYADDLEAMLDDLHLSLEEFETMYSDKDCLTKFIDYRSAKF